MEIFLRLSIVFFILVLSACTSTTNLDLSEVTPSSDVKTTFNISVENGPSSVLTQYIGSNFCNVNFNAVIDSVNLSSEWDKLAKVSFENSSSNESLSILFYFSESEGTVTPLVKHSADEFAEPLGMEFSLGEKIFSSMYLSDGDFGVSLEPASIMDSIIDVIENPQTGRMYEVNFEYSIIDIDFAPDLVKFYGISVDAVFDNIRIKNDC